MSEQERLAAKRMRMHRLAVGWSAEQLSQEYAKGGAGVLTRTTIAKIEGGIRLIKAGELDAVARVFGLTSADLLGLNGPSVVLSYAAQDRGTGQEISAWLSDRGFRVRSASQPGTDEPGADAGQASAIDAAQAFVVLLTPSFLSSPRCKQELDLATKREQQLVATGLPASFIHVLRVADPADLADSALAAHPLTEFSATSERAREVALSQCGASIVASARASAARVDQPPQIEDQDEFLSRGEELERVLYGLRKAPGANFWLVLGPPGFGKSWFLGQLAAKAAEPASGGWVPTLVDLRAAEKTVSGPASRPDDAMRVVRHIFGLEQSQSSEPKDELLDIAKKIIRSGRPWLYLLDSAELLPASIVAQLREYLSKIYEYLQNPRTTEARLAIVVASRQDDGWGGIAPAPRPSVLPLTELEPSVVQEALEGLARRMPGLHSRAELREDASLVQRATEGMPELVQRTLAWIQAEEWLEIDRLENPQVFEEIVTPYIQDRLLSPDALLPGEEGESEQATEHLTALRSSLRALVRYRFITSAHVYYHLDNDCSLRDALQQANWSSYDLWQAIGDMALLLRPLVEPWHEIHPAIRRLLFRYFYSLDEGADAHARARDFSKEWASQLTGKDQVVGIVEAIWHEAARLRLSGKQKMEAELPGFARALAREIRPSAYSKSTLPFAYTKAALLDYAVQRMESDHELQRELADVGGLFDKVTQVIRAPEAQED